MKGTSNATNRSPHSDLTPGRARRARAEQRPVLEMIAPLDIFLEDMPPGLNNAYVTRIVKGTAYRPLSEEAKHWKAGAIPQIRAIANRKDWSMIKKTPMRISILYRAPNILVWDIDGKAKLLIDAAMEALGLDDRYIMALHQSKERYEREQVYMRIMQWGEE